MRVLMMMYANVANHRGDAIRALETARNLKALGIHVVLLVPSFGKIPDSVPFPVHYVYQPNIRFLNHLIWNTYGLVLASRLVRHYRPDLVYCDVVPGSIAPLWVARLCGRPLVVEINGLSAQDVALYRSAGDWHVKLTRCIDAQLYEGCSAIVSAAGWANALFSLESAERQKVRIVPLAANRELFVPMDKSSARLQLGFDVNWQIAAFIGYLGPWQGLEQLVEVAPTITRACPGARFLVVGDGPLLPLIQRRAQDYGLTGSFICTGEVPYRDVPRYIAAADIGLSLFPPNRGIKGGVSAMKTLSYLACGRPVIASDMDELAQTILAHGAGLVLRAGESSDLRDALIGVFSDQGLLSKLTKAAFPLGAALPSWKDVAAELAMLFEELV